jgi:hypothetical protein
MYLNTLYSHSGLKRKIAMFVIAGLLFVLTTAFTLPVHAAAKNITATSSARANIISATVSPHAARDAVSVYVWATNVNVRYGDSGTCFSYPSTQNCTPVTTISTQYVTDDCQIQGETVHADGYTNNWWSWIETSSGYHGWVSNIFIRGGQKISGVPDCVFV